MQDEVISLCSLLARGAHGTRGSRSSSAYDADEVLEHAALLLWKTLQSGSGDDEGDAAVRALLHVDRKAWNRIARLLFASSSGVVQAVVAVMSAVVSCKTPPLCVLGGKNGGAAGNSRGRDENDGAAEEDEPPLQRSVYERVWRSEWWQCIIEKIEDCYSLLCLSQQTLQQHRPRSLSGDEELERSKDAGICERLLNVIGVVSRHQALLMHGDDTVDNRGGEDRARMNEVVELFLSLCTSRVRSIASCASSNLLSLLRGEGTASTLTSTKLLSDSIVVGHIAKWLVESGAECNGTVQNAGPGKVNRTRHEHDMKKEILQLQYAYFDLLVFGVSQSSASEEVSCLVMDKVNILQLCTLFLSYPNAELQEKALHLLTAALQTSSPAQQNKVSVFCSNIRISGLLIPICWLMGHSRREVADAAAKLVNAAIESSPTADILRALIEQGCAIILSVLSPMPTTESTRQLQQDQGSNQNEVVARDCGELLHWMAVEIVSEQILTATVSSILRSSNVLLQKNVILSLLLMSRRNPELKQLLECEEHFLDEVVHVAIEASEDGSLAAVLLGAALNWCDKCSVLKLEDSGSSFRQSKNGSKLRDVQGGSQVGDAALPSNIPPVIKIKHKHEVVVAEVDGALLYQLSKLVRKFVDTMPLQSCEPQIQLSQFRVSTIHLFTEVLPKSQQEAVIILKSKDIVEFCELLELSKYIECSKCWHFTTFALNHTLNGANWFGIFQFAIKIRHPSLMLRAGKTALECFEKATRNGNSTEHLVSQTPGGTSASIRHFPELKTAAFDMFQEVFYAEKSIRDPDQST